MSMLFVLVCLGHTATATWNCAVAAAGAWPRAELLFAGCSRWSTQTDLIITWGQLVVWWNLMWFKNLVIPYVQCLYWLYCILDPLLNRCWYFSPVFVVAFIRKLLALRAPRIQVSEGKTSCLDLHQFHHIQYIHHSHAQLISICTFCTSHVSFTGTELDTVSLGSLLSALPWPKALAALTGSPP